VEAATALGDVVHSDLLRRFSASVAGVSFAAPDVDAKGKSMSAFRVTPDQLESMGATVGRVSGDVRAQHQHLRAQLSPLFGSDWAGSASAQFAALYDQFDAHARGMSEALDGIGQLLARAGVAYADVEAQVTASFR
jgi:WXG100 family type VII secretion target